VHLKQGKGNSLYLKGRVTQSVIHCSACIKIILDKIRFVKKRGLSFVLKSFEQVHNED